jgi:formylmethanofuran dehydrogenase subunit B
MKMKLVKNIVCPFCGTLCDDIICKVENNKIVGTMNACRIGHSKFVHEEGAERYTEPMIRKNGELVEVSIDEAVDKVANILTKAKRPLIYGFSCTDCDSQAIGVELAEEAKTLINNTASVCHGPSVLALQDAGYTICTFGEVKNRADVIIYWGCNPICMHIQDISQEIHFQEDFLELEVDQIEH